MKLPIPTPVWVGAVLGATALAPCCWCVGTLAPMRTKDVVVDTCLGVFFGAVGGASVGLFVFGVSSGNKGRRLRTDAARKWKRTDVNRSLDWKSTAIQEKAPRLRDIDAIQEERKSIDF